MLSYCLEPKLKNEFMLSLLDRTVQSNHKKFELSQPNNKPILNSKNYKPLYIKLNYELYQNRPNPTNPWPALLIFADRSLRIFIFCLCLVAPPFCPYVEIEDPNQNKEKSKCQLEYVAQRCTTRIACEANNRFVWRLCHFNTSSLSSVSQSSHV